MKLNLGCDKDIREGWINIDLYPQIVSIKGNVKNLEYKDRTCGEIFAGNVLEHLTYKEAKTAVKEWYRVLKKGGTLEIVVPDIVSIAKNFENTDDKIRNELLKEFYGKQDRKGQYHYSGWYSDNLTQLLEETGFTILESGIGAWKNDLRVVCKK